MGRYNLTIWEAGSKAKASSVGVHTVDLNAGNIAAQLVLAGLFKDAVLAVSLGNEGTEEILATANEVAKNPSSNLAAQRENKWLVSYIDTVTNRGGSFTIPCYNSALLGGDGETMDTTATEYTDLVDAVENYIRSNAGNAVTVTSVKFAARTL